MPEISAETLWRQGYNDGRDKERLETIRILSHGFTVAGRRYSIESNDSIRDLHGLLAQRWSRPPVKPPKVVGGQGRSQESMDGSWAGIKFALVGLVAVVISAALWIAVGKLLGW